MRILVTGSEGSLMQWVIPKLLKKEHKVIGVDNCSRYGDIKRDRKYEFNRGDLTDELFVSQVCEDIDIIIQSAAKLYGVKGFHKYPADILSNDITLHKNLLHQSVKDKIKNIIYISSSMVYERCDQIPFKEEYVNNIKVPSTDYGLSKVVGERMTKAFQKQYNLNYTIFRPFNILTPHEKSDEESHVFSDFIRKLLIEKQNPMEIYGSGEQIRCFTWIDDVARGIVKAVDNEKAKNESFNLGNPEKVTMIELALRIYNKLISKGLIENKGLLEFKHLPIYEDDIKVRVPDASKAKKLLDWKPKVMLDKALDICIEEAAKNV